MERRGCPIGPAADRDSRRVVPGRCIERRGALRSAGQIALGLRHEEEFPDYLAGLGVESEHVPFSAFGVAAGVADEDEAVPGDRRGLDELAPARVGEHRLPDALAGLEVI